MKSILVCTNHRGNPNQPSCGARGAISLKNKLSAEIDQSGIAMNVKEIQCLGECESGPNLRFLPGGPLFRHVDEHDLKAVLKAAKTFAKD
jgi:predicted metal-binding protein